MLPSFPVPAASFFLLSSPRCCSWSILVLSPLGGTLGLSLRKVGHSLLCLLGMFQAVGSR